MLTEPCLRHRHAISSDSHENPVREVLPFFSPLHERETCAEKTAELAGGGAGAPASPHAVRIHTPGGIQRLYQEASNTVAVG